MASERIFEIILSKLLMAENSIKRAMTAEDFLRANDKNSKFIDTKGARFGILARQKYEEVYGEKPPQIMEVINGRERPVYIYPHGRQDALRYAWREFNPSATVEGCDSKD